MRTVSFRANKLGIARLRLVLNKRENTGQIYGGTHVRQSFIVQNITVMQSANTIGSGGGGGGSYTTGSGTGSRTRDLGLRAQKKLLGRIVSTGAGRSLFIDDATTSLLDNLYKLMESVTKSNPHMDKKEPEKVLKNIVKLSIKV